MRTYLFVLLFFPILLFGQSQKTPNTLQLDSHENRPVAKIGDAEWLAGSYQAEGFGGTIEEIWAPPSGGTMMGMFKLWKDDSVVFYEFFTLVEQNNSLSLKLKHFNPDLSGWEEKSESVTFDLVRISPDTLWFDGLTYINTENGVRVFLAMKTKDGYKEMEFQYRPND